MNVGIIGLGLIGGSLAKSIKKNTAFRVFGFDKEKTITDYAALSGITDGTLDDKTIGLCDVLFVALCPKAAENAIEINAPKFKKGALVIDCVGIKRDICEQAFKIAKENGFIFIGGHPMAGTQFSGLKNAKDTLFHNACFVLTPKPDEDVAVIGKARDIIIEIGFSRVSVMTPERHDKLIAFTSQLAHIVSNAYVKSPSAKDHKGISAGSYKDLTRVAYLNENMWTELFMDNKNNLIFEIDNIVSELQKYSEALKNDDSEALCRLLKEGKEAKIKAD